MRDNVRLSYLAERCGWLTLWCSVLNVDVPGGHAIGRLFRGVTPPEALDQHRRSGDLTIEVLLALLLLHLQSESGTEDTLKFFF